MRKAEEWTLADWREWQEGKKNLLMDSTLINLTLEIAEREPPKEIERIGSFFVDSPRTSGTFSIFASKINEIVDAIKEIQRRLP
jgi:hypothetical protein